MFYKEIARLAAEQNLINAASSSMMSTMHGQVCMALGNMHNPFLLFLNQKSSPLSFSNFSTFHLPTSQSSIAALTFTQPGWAILGWQSGATRMASCPALLSAPIACSTIHVAYTANWR